MMETMFDHDRLDVYQLAIQYTAESFAVAKGLSGLHRHARDQWLRAAQSIPLNIAEGNGKRSPRDRARFFEIARGSALECAAVQDVLAVSGGLMPEASLVLKRKLRRIVAMLTRMTAKSGTVAQSQGGQAGAVDYEHEEGPRTVAAPDGGRRSGFRCGNRPGG